MKIKTIISYLSVIALVSGIVDSSSGMDLSQYNVDELKLFSEKGSPRATLMLGTMYERGAGGLEKNIEKACQLYEKAANMRDPDALYILGSIFETGNSIREKNIISAIYYYYLAAKYGHKVAPITLGDLCSNWNAVSGLDDTAEYWYNFAAKKHDSITARTRLLANEKKPKRASTPVEKIVNKKQLNEKLIAQVSIPDSVLPIENSTLDGCCKQNTKVSSVNENAPSKQNVNGVKKIDEIKRERSEVTNSVTEQESAINELFFDAKRGDKLALRKLDEYANDGNVFAMHKLGNLYRIRPRGIAKDYNLVMRYYQRSAEKGYPPAQNDLAWMYSCGLDKANRDYDAAIYWYRKAIAGGHIHSHTNLGWIYMNVDEKKDSKLALEHLKLAAEAGDIAGQFYLAHMYERDRNYHDAVKWYRLAIKGNHIASMYRLGYLYEYGLGVDNIDVHAACELYEEASDQGHFMAAFALGSIFENGKIGPKDLDKALYWYKIAKKNGHRNVDSKIANLEHSLGK